MYGPNESRIANIEVRTKKLDGEAGRRGWKWSLNLRLQFAYFLFLLLISIFAIPYSLFPGMRHESFFGDHGIYDGNSVF